MSRTEDLIFRNASLEKEVVELREGFSILKGWLRVNNSGIWQDFVEFLKLRASKNDSKSSILSE